MQPQRTPTLVYAACSIVLGIIAVIAAIVWHLSVGEENVNGGAPAGNIVSGILGFVGFSLVLWSVLYFITIFARRQGGQEEDTVIPSKVLDDTPDPTLQKPHDQSIFDVPLDRPIDQSDPLQTKPLPHTKER